MEVATWDVLVSIKRKRFSLFFPNLILHSTLDSKLPYFFNLLAIKFSDSGIRKKDLSKKADSSNQMFNLTSPLNESATQVSHYDSDRSPPSEFSSYDYIVIGGGTSGSVLSNSLSSNPENEVLVLEAGPRANFAVSIPLSEYLILLYYSKRLIDPISYSSVANIRAYDPRFGFQLSTVPQKNLENRRVETFSGKILGGTSAVNASVFTKSCHEELVSRVSCSSNSLRLTNPTNDLSSSPPSFILLEILGI